MKAEWAAGHLGKASRTNPEIIFGRVHEDIESEMLAAAAAPGRGRAFTIGSGGCSAFSLLSLGFERVDAVDINSAQIHLINLKRAILERASRDECIRACTQDAYELAKQSLPDLEPESRAFWERNLPRCRHGLLFTGRADNALRWLVRLYHVFVCSQRRMFRFLDQTDPSQQEAEWRSSIATWRWNLALRMMFNTGLLRIAYGSSFLSRLPANPAGEIHEQFHEGGTRSPARQSSPLWLMFARTFAPDGDKRLPRYLRATEFDRVRDGTKRLVTTCADASAFLFAQPAGSFDALILSNILDLASAEEARELSSAIAHAAKRGAVIVARAIFSNAAPEFATEALRKDHDLTRQVRDQDRSLICRHATVYRRG